MNQSVLLYNSANFTALSGCWGQISAKSAVLSNTFINANFTALSGCWSAAVIEKSEEYITTLRKCGILMALQTCYTFFLLTLNTNISITKEYLPLQDIISLLISYHYRKALKLWLHDNKKLFLLSSYRE